MLPPPLRLGWAKAAKYPLTVALLKFWAEPNNHTMRWHAAIQMHRAATHGVPSILSPGDLD